MANDQPAKIYLQWMNDAYSMELALVPVLENHAKDMEEKGLDSSRVRQHVTETQRHADLMKDCIIKAGGDVSGLKATLGKTMGAVQSVSTGMFSDEQIKNALADHATEHFEIACYTSLRAAAETMGDTTTVSACESILKDEMAMAAWLKDQIPVVTRRMMDDARS